MRTWCWAGPGRCSRGLSRHSQHSWHHSCTHRSRALWPGPMQVCDCPSSNLCTLVTAPQCGGAPRRWLHCPSSQPCSCHSRSLPSTARPSCTATTSRRSSSSSVFEMPLILYHNRPNSSKWRTLGATRTWTAFGTTCASLVDEKCLYARAHSNASVVARTRRLHIKEPLPQQPFQHLRRHPVSACRVMQHTLASQHQHCPRRQTVKVWGKM